MSFTTTSADNIITIGDTNDTIKLNQIMPMYTSVPTFDLNYIGGFISGTKGTPGSFKNTPQTMFTFNNVKPAQYLVSISYSMRSDTTDPAVNICISNTSTSTTSTQNFVFYTNSSNEAYFSQTIPYSCSTTGALYVNLHCTENLITTSFDYGYLIRIG